MSRIPKCKDYNIIRLMFRDTKNKSDKYQWDRAKKVNQFKWEIIKHVTGRDDTWWIWTHMMESMDSAYEEMDDKYGILTVRFGDWDTFLIPKDNPELFEWLKENTPLKYRIVKKTYLGWFHDASIGIRDRARDFTKRQIAGTLKDSYPKEYILED